MRLVVEAMVLGRHDAGNAGLACRVCELRGDLAGEHSGSSIGLFVCFIEALIKIG